MVELQFSGYYLGPSTYLDTYTFLKLYADGRWVFAEGLNPDYDLPARIAALGVDDLSEHEPIGDLEDNGTTLRWGRYRRGQDIPALNCGNQVVGRLADCLEETCDSDTWGRFQVEIVGPGQLKPTTHNVVLTFVPSAPQDAPDAKF